MMIDKLTVDRIYAAADIVDVISDFVALRKRGVNYQALCPFHDEKTPSFVVSPTKGVFKCFGCGKGGNAVTFVMEHEGMSYPQALRYVAAKYGVEIEERELTIEEKKEQNKRESMLVATDFAYGWFKQTLTSTDEGRSVGLSYFKERGFTDEMIELFGLGYCPERGGQFSKAALAEGYQEEYLIESGLSGKSSYGDGLYDRFYGRVLFPIHSMSGRVIAFGGRTLRSDKNVAKYINSPESEIYSKSKVLYGLFFAKRAIMQEEQTILVEGYTDVMSMYQAGVKNVVASSGTALTEEQVRLLKRFSPNVTLIFDGDEAGIKASLRGVDVILREGMNVRVVSLPEGEDPDSFARSHKSREIREYIADNAEDFIAFKTRVLLKGSENDPIERANLIRDIVGSISEIPEPIMRSVYIKQTAEEMGMEQEVLAAEVARRRISHSSDRDTRDFIRNQQQRQQQERRRATEAANLTGITAGSSMEELEKELVKYLLKYGEHDFRYKEGKNIVSLNVAEIIINDLEANGLTLSNKECRELYERYVELHQELSESDFTENNSAGSDSVGSDSAESNSEKSSKDGSSKGRTNTPQSGEDSEAEGGEKAERVGRIEMYHFVNHSNPKACALAVDLLTDNDNYAVSKMWKKFDIIVETEVERLAEIVPRAVILYKSKAIEFIIGELQERLKDSTLSEEELGDVLSRIAALNKERISISRKLSRLIL